VSVRISAELQARLDTAFDAATAGVSDLAGAEFWAHVAKSDTEMAEVWKAARRELRPEAESVLLRLLMDAENYRRREAEIAAAHVADYEKRGEDHA
jgi:hypothetical protein